MAEWHGHHFILLFRTAAQEAKEFSKPALMLLAQFPETSVLCVLSMLNDLLTEVPLSPVAIATRLTCHVLIATARPDGVVCAKTLDTGAPPSMDQAP